MKPLYSLPFMLLYQTQLFIELKVLSYNNVKQVLHFFPQLYKTGTANPWRGNEKSFG
jgi:hypothetical protein